MTRTLVTTCLIVLAAALFAWSEGGHFGMGVIIGCLSGAALACACVGWQQRAATRAPDRALNLSVVVFVIYLLAAILGAALFHYVDAVAAGADWTAFLFAFAFAVFGVMTVGAFDIARTLSSLGASSDDDLLNGAEA